MIAIAVLSLLTYLLLGLGLGAGWALWNTEIRLLYVALFPGHALAICVWPRVRQFGREIWDAMWEERKFFDP